MLKLALLVLVLASPAFAQNTPAAPLADGCGANEVHFEVKTDKKQHPTAQPDAGKALVYVVGDTSGDHATAHVGTLPTRFGVDGVWVGANGFRSYFFFPVDPGDHRLCTNLQSKLKGQVNNSTAATSFTVQAGQSYYFRTKTPVSGYRIQLVPVDPAEAQVLLANASWSTFQVKK
jgi:hypothetical protein